MVRALSGLGSLIEPARAGLKEQKRDLETTLREINHYKSAIGIARRFLGRIQQRRITNTLDVLPRIGQAITDGLYDRAERFYDLRREQLAYVDRLSERIGNLNGASLPEGFSGEEYMAVIQRTSSRERKERQEAYRALTRDFEAWSEYNRILSSQGQGVEECERFQGEAKGNALGCENVYKQLRFMADTLQGRVNHLESGLSMHREIIILGKDLLAAKRGLTEIAERGSEVYETVKESYSRMGDLMKELQSPRSGFLTSGSQSYTPPRLLRRV